jgi:uncharacterized damage-inducible protein DinB
MRIADALLPEFDHEMANTRKTLERAPEEKWDWRPHAKSFTLKELANHLANIPGWIAGTFQGDSFDVAPPGGEPYKDPVAATRSELLAKFDANVKAGRAAMAAADNETYMRPWTMLVGGQPMFTMPKAAVLRTWVFNHSVHHRAQLAVYLRLNDIPVPALYGPSADEQP